MFISPQQQQLLEQIEKYSSENSKALPSNRKVKINKPLDNQNQKNLQAKSPRKSPKKSPRKSPLKQHNQNEILRLPNLHLNIKNENYGESYEISPINSPRSGNSSVSTSPVTSPRSFEMMLNDDLNENFCYILEDKNRYSTEQIEIFLQRGADINYQSENFQNSTPIMIVCGSLGRKGVNASCLRMLLSGRQRAKYHLLDNRRMGAMHYAAKFNNNACVLELLNFGADIDVLGGTHNKTMPIHLAAANDHIETMRHLLDNGANPDKLDCSGQSPLETAITSKVSEETIDLLVRHSNTTILLQKCMDNCRVQKYR